MPRPLERRRYPKPKPVTIRHVGSDEKKEVVRADDFLAYQYRREVRPVFDAPGDDPPVIDDILELQALYALQEGDVVAPVSRRAGGLWWFVVSVDGAERTVLARTRIMGVRREETFAFEEILRRPPETLDEGVEADAYRRRLGLKDPPRGPSSIETRRLALVGTDDGPLAPGLPQRYQDLLDDLLPSERCHGYANEDCGWRSLRRRHGLAA